MMPMQTAFGYKERPGASPKFTGRKLYLDHLNEFFSIPASPHQTNRVFLLWGMGGAGKTQVCLKFAEICQDR